jgi:hypothetical protein
MTIEVNQNPDGSLNISWDANDPTEMYLNDWDESDFINAIQKKLEDVQ